MTFGADLRGLKWMINLADTTVKLKRLQFALMVSAFDTHFRANVKQHATDTLLQLLLESTNESDIDEEVVIMAATTEAQEILNKVTDRASEQTRT